MENQQKLEIVKRLIKYGQVYLPEAVKFELDGNIARCPMKYDMSIMMLDLNTNIAWCEFNEHYLEWLEDRLHD